MDYFFLTFLLEEERLTLEREELELREERLTVDRDEPELREDRLTVEREELELRDLVTELLEGVREGDLRTELLEDFELREGAVAARPLKEADEEGVEENLRIKLLVPLLFSVEVERFVTGLVRDGVWEREEEKRLTMLLVDDGSLLVTAERLGVVRFTLWVEDLNLEGTILFPCVAKLPDVTDFCEFGVYLFMVRLEDEIPEFLRLELVVRIEVAFTRERVRPIFPEE